MFLLIIDVKGNFSSFTFTALSFGLFQFVSSTNRTKDNVLQKHSRSTYTNKAASLLRSARSFCLFKNTKMLPITCKKKNLCYNFAVVIYLCIDTHGFLPLTTRLLETASVDQELPCQHQRRKALARVSSSYADWVIV